MPTPGASWDNAEDNATIRKLIFNKVGLALVKNLFKIFNFWIICITSDKI